MKLKLPGILAVSLVLGFLFWIIDSFINSYFKLPGSFSYACKVFIKDLQSSPDIYSRLVAIILLVILGGISIINRRKVTYKNNKLNNLKIALEQTNKKLRKYLFKDYLTGAINRRPFIELLQSKIFYMERNKKKLAILFIDLVNFKSFNDSFGHEFGDKVLIYTANKLKNCTRKSDFVGRYGGDEFTICINDIKSKNDVISIINKIHNIFSEELEIMGQKVKIRLNIGAAIYPVDGKTPDDLLRNSDNAMYRAKRNNEKFKLYS